MHPRRILPILVILALIGGGTYWYFTRSANAQPSPLTASGTIETTAISVSPEVGGRVVSVAFQEGDAVKAGQVMIQLDPTLLQAQRKQAAAALAAAQANYNSLKAGAANQQLQAALASAQMQVLAAQQALSDLNDKAALAAAQANQAVAVAQTALSKANSELTSANAGSDADRQALAVANQKLATAALADAQAHAARLSNGPDPDLLALAQARLTAAQAGVTAAQAALAPAQLDAAQAQADTAQAALDLLDAQLGKLVVAAPADGVILSRAIEPGEVASPGATLLVIGGLLDLKVTVFVPEGLYGQIQLGQAASLSVDSYPGRVFEAKVRQIANQAEFTPRNSQTVDGRKDTVFAVQLSIANADQALKPGMPADVSFAK